VILIVFASTVHSESIQTFCCFFTKIPDTSAQTLNSTLSRL